MSAFLIEGDLRPAGTQLAIALRLIDTRDGRQIQTERRTIERAELDDQEARVRPGLRKAGVPERGGARRALR
ncbi:MAG TPA: hypothetical protein VET86_03925 [Casimicrobiaceae bacterium]|nr:hypothetical protein [Casimicrobiaceae bacterium]